MNQELTPLEAVKKYWEDYNEKKYSSQEGTILEGLPEKTNQEIKYASTELSGPAYLTKEQIQEIQKNILYRRKYKLK